MVLEGAGVSGGLCAGLWAGLISGWVDCGAVVSGADVLGAGALGLFAGGGLEAAGARSPLFVAAYPFNVLFPVPLPEFAPGFV